LIVLLGVWGGLLPYVGASFDYTYTPDTSWTWTAGRFWLELVPAIAAILGGLVLMASRSRATAMLGGWLAAAAGVWFVVGPLLSPLWDENFIGVPVGGKVTRSVEQIGLFFGLGAAIVFFAAFALGRLAVVGVRDVEYGERYARERQERLLRERETRTRTVDVPGDHERIDPATERDERLRRAEPAREEARVGSAHGRFPLGRHRHADDAPREPHSE